MGKINYYLGDLQFGKNKSVDSHLEDIMNSVTHHTTNPYIKSMLKKMPNFFNPMATRLVPKTKADGNEAIASDEYFKALGITNPTFKQKLEFSKYNQQCMDNQEILNKIYRGYDSGKAVHKFAAAMFSATITNENSFVLSCFQMGMEFNCSDEELVKLINQDCLTGQYPQKMKWPTQDDVINGWAKQSKQVEALKYLNRLGFISEILHDYAVCQSSNVYQHQEMLNIFSFFADPNLSPKVREEMQDLISMVGSRKTYYEYTRNEKGELDKDSVSQFFQELQNIRLNNKDLDKDVPTK